MKKKNLKNLAICSILWSSKGEGGWVTRAIPCVRPVSMELARKNKFICFLQVATLLIVIVFFPNRQTTPITFETSSIVEGFSENQP